MRTLSQPGPCSSSPDLYQVASHREPYYCSVQPMMTTQSILICDDDPLLLELLEYRLASKGYRVTIARDGGEALELARNSAPDAIVLDAMMPVIDGYEVLRRIRNDENMGSIPVLMLTARKQERDVLSALELGASDFMVKPFIPEELAARLARLLAGQRK